MFTPLQPCKGAFAGAFVDQPFWKTILACPACRKPLRESTRCDHCGVAFSDEGGTPRLIAPEARREVHFEFPQIRSEADDHRLAQLMVDPPPRSSKDPLPYHLDAAHALCLERCPAGSRVIEIGCGGGQNRRWMQSRGFEYVGTDISSTRVFEWLRRSGGPDLLCDVHFLPFQDSQFDVVYSAALFEHVACPHLAFQEAFRVLKPGGFFLANCAFLEPWHDHSYYHSSPLGVVEWLELAGFAIEYIWPERGYHCFKSIPDMTFIGPFKLMAYAGRTLYGLYRLQMATANLHRRLGGRPTHRPIVWKASIAGAIDWIARRPGSQRTV